MQRNGLKQRLAREGDVVRVKGVTITRRGEYVVFSGAPTGEHKLAYAASSNSRLAAHLVGYCGHGARRRRP